ncbi:hypothetical protein JHW43_007374 [Diplocarpon mali]|nr:hypothetical protein JHW43_007374 [Diplocarpon mali]
MPSAFDALASPEMPRVERFDRLLDIQNSRRPWGPVDVDLGRARSLLHTALGDMQAHFQEPDAETLATRKPLRQAPGDRSICDRCAFAVP